MAEEKAPRKYVKFTGRFKDLKPAGWTFQKLFANNYRQYHKSGDGSEWGQGCRIWQHLGGYLEIEDLFGWSYVLVEKIADGSIYDLSHQDRNMSDFYTEVEKEEDRPETYSRVFWLKHNRETGEFHGYHSPEYKKCRLIEWNHGEYELPKAEHLARTKEHYSTYREFILQEDVIDMIKDLLDKGWIEVAEDHRKD